METEEHQQAFEQLYEKMTQNGEITGYIAKKGSKCVSGKSIFHQRSSDF